MKIILDLYTFIKEEVAAKSAFLRKSAEIMFFLKYSTRCSENVKKEKESLHFCIACSRVSDTACKQSIVCKELSVNNFLFKELIISDCN